MKKIKVNCKKCGIITLEKTWFCDNGEEGFIVPKKFCPTLRSYNMFYKDVVGYSPKSEGVEIIEDKMVLNHTNPEEDGEDWNEHELEELEVWRDDL